MPQPALVLSSRMQEPHRLGLCILDHLKYQYLRLSISTNIRPWIRVDPAPAVEYTGELYIKVYQAAIVPDP